MATPTNLPASFSSGAVLTAAQMNDLRGAFRILQVVSGSTTGAVASASTTYVDTGISATITPQSSSSKVIALISASPYSLTAGTGGGLRVYRDATLLQQFTDVAYSNVGNNLIGFSTLVLDSPATTSAVVYKMQQNRSIGVGTFFTQVNSNPGTIILMEVSA